MKDLLHNMGSNQKKLSIVSFSLFSGWLLSVPFEGQILYALLAHSGVEQSPSVLTIFAAFIGLFTCGFFVKKQLSAKVTMIVSSVVVIAASLIFFLPFSNLWYLAIASSSFFSGLYVASWAFFFKAYTESKDRFKTAAEVIIYSNILMVLLGALTMITSAFIALGISIILIIASLLMVLRLNGYADENHLNTIIIPEQSVSSRILRPLLFLYLFIVVITINSGLMYRVVNPAFDHLAPLTNFYWAIPYIMVIVILRNLPQRFNQAYVLYIALAMVGLAFLAFMNLDRSYVSYLVIDTLMLGAFGVFDLFWWSILGSFLNFSNKPAQIFGIGLSMNVMGIFLGGIIANRFISIETDYLTISVIALTVIFIVLMMLPILKNLLAGIFKNHVFLIQHGPIVEGEPQKVVFDSKFAKDKQLTEKEKEVVELLIRGYTYKAISEKLYISENTMKFHVKNIYQKLHIKNKMELIKMFSDY